MSSRITTRIEAVLYWTFRAFLGLFLLAAGIGKALDLPGYVAAIHTYQTGLGATGDWIVAIALTALETTLAICLLSGWRLVSAAKASATLHGAYLLALAVTLVRGVEVPNCGCFGVFLARPLEPVTLLEDLVLIAISIGLFLIARKRTRSSAQTPRPDS